jgi:phage anti-repressor protein
MIPKIIWTFGDSFTFGSKCHEGDEYYEMYEPMQTWPELLSDYLDMELTNVSQGGLSNLEILKNVVKNLKHINEGDFVVVSDTSPTRLMSFKDKTTWSRADYPEESGVVMDYILEEVIPFETNWKDWMEEIMMDLFESLDGIECRFWSHVVWDKFETIKQHTNGEIDDLHWSWNGHREMFEYMKERI